MARAQEIAPRSLSSSSRRRGFSARSAAFDPRRRHGAWQNAPVGDRHDRRRARGPLSGDLPGVGKAQLGSRTAPSPWPRRADSSRWAAACARAGYRGWTIVNYDLLRRDIGALLTHRFNGVVFDEGHYIKNHRSQRSVLSRRLVAQGTTDPVVHVLTGTPLTNRPRDLFPLLQLVGHSLDTASSPSPSDTATVTRTTMATG